MEYIKHFPVPFLEDLVQSRCLPFLGAGMSLNAKVPKGKKMLDWDGLGRAIAENIPEYQYTNAIEAISAYSHEFSRVKLMEALSSVLLISDLVPGKVHEEFCRLQFDRVVTTNFDFLLEAAYSRVEKYCVPLISEDQLAVVGQKAGVRLLKLHGDFHHPSRLIATEDDYDSFVAKYPLLATHLSSLLIDYTALFIGYSLDDPDFRSIWWMVKERLGSLRRPAYVLQVGAQPHSIARYERRGVKVINIPKNPHRSYAEILEGVFKELREYWSSKTIYLSTSTEPESQAELALPSGSQSRLVFFAVPTKLAAAYKSKIYPIVEKLGFSPVMAVDVVSPGDNLMAKVHALIERSAVVIADTSSQTTLFEVGMVASIGGNAKPLILIVEENSKLAADIPNRHVLRRPSSFDEDDQPFMAEIELALKSIFSSISHLLEEESKRLLAKKEYRAAVISVFSELEHCLRSTLVADSEDVEVGRLSLSGLVLRAYKRHIMSVVPYETLKIHIHTRNRLVHGMGSITSLQARKVVRDVGSLIRQVRSRRA